MPRIPALVLTAALTFSPAVVGACAALLCAPAGGQGTHTAHQGHHEPAAASVHADHQGPGHHAPGAASAPRVRAISDHECCATGSALAAAVAVVTSRLDATMVVDATVTSPADISNDAGRQHSPPPRPHGLPPRPVTSLAVLRI